MAISNHERVGKALELLREGLAPFVEREFVRMHKDDALIKAKNYLRSDRLDANKPFAKWDAAVILGVMWDSWNDVFRITLGHAERTLVSELRGVRNKWAHQEPFSSDDAYRALDSAARLLEAVSAPQSDGVEKSKQELLRIRFEEQVRHEKRKSAGTAVESVVTGNLKAWRDVVTPHKDVASGRYQQAEFAADLWQVHLGEGSAEYRDPQEFFRRTYLTESLKRLLVGAVRRLGEGGGDPVIQLQTNFGGGKTHSMLAVYHLTGGVPASELPGVDAVMAEAGAKSLPKVKRVVLVGNKISPGNPVKKPDGTVVRTLWGELTWQLGGKKAFARVRADDENATSPGDVLRELLEEYGPCIILIDEWVAYARQLHDDATLPAGTFETQFTFAQLLTESAKFAKNCLLMISLPASDTAVSPHTQADDSEVGGQRGREALERLRNVIGRVESSWRPASAEEGFEIVRRRLFEPIVQKQQSVDRDRVASEFHALYRTQHQEFPPECRDSDYEKRIRAAYPIHPEVFDRLYEDWSTLAKFQRTRGVLRLMAALIHSLWEKGDRNPLILPSNIPIDDPRVQFELTRYLPDNWIPVIEKDVDGPGSLPLRIDGDVPNLGKFSACRRVARTIYMGSAPVAGGANRGIEDRRVRLGCVMPGESPAIFGDALRRLAGAATYLYADGSRYWYSTQPTVTKLADDRAEQLKREADRVAEEIRLRLAADAKRKGDFVAVHPCPPSSGDVPNDESARLVILGLDHSHAKGASSQALTAAKEILASRGSSPRSFQNVLVFLAVDKTRLQDLDEAVRRHLAWKSILAEKNELDLSPHQVKQAETQLGAAEGTVVARVPEAYQWLLVPTQATPKGEVDWQTIRLSGQGPLAERASKKLKNDELLITSLAESRLRMELDRVPLWRGDHVPVKQLVEDFPRYLYLPRLKSSAVLLAAIRDGISLLSWDQDGFAYADGFDEAEGRYRGLKAAANVSVSDASDPGLLVRPEVAKKQMTADRKKLDTGAGEIADGGNGTGDGDTGGGDKGGGTPPKPLDPPKARRFHGTVALDPTRAGREAGRVAEEVIAHLTGLVGSSVRITVEIEADIPKGVPDSVLRIVTENCRTLKFKSQEFEVE